MMVFTVLTRAVCQLPQSAVIPHTCRRDSEQDFVSQVVRGAQAGAAAWHRSLTRLRLSLRPGKLSLTTLGKSF